MLTGRNAIRYRLIISGVTIDELAKYIDIDIVKRVEDENAYNVSTEMIRIYYNAVNKIKQEKLRETLKNLPAYVDKTMPAFIEPEATNVEATPSIANASPKPETKSEEPVKPKPKRKPRQPKTPKS